MKIEGIIVLLGSPNSATGKLYSVAKQRCKHAIEEYFNREGWKILPTGGYGEHFNTTDKPHAHYLKKYLLENGIPENSILEFAESKNTLEDASLSKPIVLKHFSKEILVVTSDYHLDRAKFIFEKEYKETEIKINFSVCTTDEQKCEFNLASQIIHEKKALLKLKENYPIPN